jgi:hypothetical protein
LLFRYFFLWKKTVKKQRLFPYFLFPFFLVPLLFAFPFGAFFVPFASGKRRGTKGNKVSFSFGEKKGKEKKVSPSTFARVSSFGRNSGKRRGTKGNKKKRDERNYIPEGDVFGSFLIPCGEPEEENNEALFYSFLPKKETTKITEGEQKQKGQKTWFVSSFFLF